MIFIRFIIFALIVMSYPAFAQERAEGLADDTKIIGPEPDWDNPRKIVLQVTTKDEFHVNNVYYNAINLQKFYGADNVKIEIVFYGPGIRSILKETAISSQRVQSLQDYEIDFVACNNTLTTIGKRTEDLLPGIRVVTSGIAEIVERKIDGWHYIIP